MAWPDDPARARREAMFAQRMLLYNCYGVSICTCQMQASVSANCSHKSLALFVILYRATCRQRRWQTDKRTHTFEHLNALPPTAPMQGASARVGLSVRIPSLRGKMLLGLSWSSLSSQGKLRSRCKDSRVSLRHKRSSTRTAFLQECEVREERSLS